MSDYKLKTGKIEDKVVGAYKKIEDKFSDKFLNEDGSMKVGKVGDAVVGGYKKIENGVVGAYKKVENKFADTFLEPVDKTENKER